MKLYSKRQLLVRTAAAGITAAAISALICAAVIKNSHRTENPQHTETAQSSGSVTETQEAVPQKKEAELQTNSPVLQVINNSSDYTQDEIQNISVYEKCNEAVVNITTKVMDYNWFYEPELKDSGSGSGSIIDKRGYVVTNVHVVKNATLITISLADGTSYEGKVVGLDESSDIAVLKFDPPKNTELKTILFGDSENLRVGQNVIAIGNPFALERTMTTGIISGLGRPIQSAKNVIIRNMIQTDAAINPGNSGGPLLDSKGRMIGINTMIYSTSGSSSGVGFAIPASTARRVVSDLLTYGRVNRGEMKLSLIQNTPRIASFAGYKISSGMIINSVEKNSLAEKAGLQGGTMAVQYGTYNPQIIYLGGDIITEIDGISISKLADYYSALEDKVPGDKVTVTVYRKGRYEKITVTLESPKNSSEA